MNPKISIITITYNSEKTLEETIKSVISQEYDNLEYVIIDGGSRDGTLEIIDKYRDKIAVVVSEPDNGISDAFNKGLKIATGEIIGIINSDDLLMPGALKAINDAYDPEVDVYRGEMIYKNIKTGFKFIGKPSMDCSVSNYIRLGVAHPSTFISKRAYQKVGGYKTHVRYIMDIDMLFRLYNSGCPFKYVPQKLALFNSGGATDDHLYKKVLERYMVIRDNGGSLLLGLYVAITCFFKDIIKVILDFIGGENLKHRLMGRHNISSEVDGCFEDDK